MLQIAAFNAMSPTIRNPTQDAQRQCSEQRTNTPEVDFPNARPEPQPARSFPLLTVERPRNSEPVNWLERSAFRSAIGTRSHGSGRKRTEAVGSTQRSKDARDLGAVTA